MTFAKYLKNLKSNKNSPKAKQITTIFDILREYYTVAVTTGWVDQTREEGDNFNK